MVTALKLSSTPAFSSDCNARAEIGASVKMKDSMVAMSGAIMPAPLAMPLIVTLALPSLTVAVATFGKVSVVMIARAASIQPSGAVCAARSPSTPSNLVASSGSPITPVEARKTSPAWQPTAFAAIEAVSAVDCRPVLPVKALALPELTTSARADPPLGRFAAAKLGAAPLDRRGRAFRAGEDAGDRRPLVHDREQHIGAALVADAGSRGRELYARNRGHLGNVGRGERERRSRTWDGLDPETGRSDRHGRDLCRPSTSSAPRIRSQDVDARR